MNKAVYVDMSWQHQAYIDGGIAAISKLASHMPKIVEAWTWIDGGKVAQGNQRLLRREQSVILQPYYDDLASRAGLGGAAELFRYFTDSPVPGGRHFHDFNPKGSLNRFKDRWEWIERDMLPAWLEMDVEKQKALCAVPVSKLYEHIHGGTLRAVLDDVARFFGDLVD